MSSTTSGANALDLGGECVSSASRSPWMCGTSAAIAASSLSRDETARPRARLDAVVRPSAADEVRAADDEHAHRRSAHFDEDIVLSADGAAHALTRRTPRWRPSFAIQLSSWSSTGDRRRHHHRRSRRHRATTTATAAGRRCRRRAAGSSRGSTPGDRRAAGTGTSVSRPQLAHCRRVHLARAGRVAAAPTTTAVAATATAARVTAGRLARTTAVRAPLRLVGEAAARVEFLVVCGEDELRSAVDAGQRSVGEWHLTTSYERFLVVRAERSVGRRGGLSDGKLLFRQRTVAPLRVDCNDLATIKCAESRRPRRRRPRPRR